MNNATAREALPPMPAWATEREDYDSNTPDPWARFQETFAEIKTHNPDSVRQNDTLHVIGVQYTTNQGDIPAGQPYFEIWVESCLGGVATSLTLDTATDLAAILTRAIRDMSSPAIVALERGMHPDWCDRRLCDTADAGTADEFTVHRAKIGKAVEAVVTTDWNGTTGQVVVSSSGDRPWPTRNARTLARDIATAADMVDGCVRTMREG